VVFSFIMAEGASERNGPISNIMNSLWSNSNNNDDAFFDSLKLVSENQLIPAQKRQYILIVQTKKQRIIGFFTSLILGAFCFTLVSNTSNNAYSLVTILLCDRHCCCYHFSF